MTSRKHWQRPDDYNAEKSPAYGPEGGSSRDYIHETMDVESCRLLRLRVQSHARDRVLPLHIFFEPSLQPWSSEVLNLFLYQDVNTGIRGSLIRYDFAPGRPLSSTVVPGAIDLTKRLHMLPEEPDDMPMIESPSQKKKPNTLYAWALLLIFLFGGIFSSTSSPKPVKSIITISDKLERLHSLSRFDKTLARHRDTIASLSRYYGLLPHESIHLAPDPSLYYYRGKTLNLVTELALTAGDFESIAHILLMNQEHVWFNSRYYDMVGFFEYMTEQFNNITLAAYRLEQTNATQPEHSTIVDLRRADFGDLVSRFLDKWFRTIDILENFHHDRFSVYSVLSYPSILPATGSDAFHQLRTIFPASPSPAKIELAFLDLESWLSSLQDDTLQIQAALTQMVNSVQNLAGNIGPSIFPGETLAARHTAAQNLLVALNKFYGASMLDRIKSAVSSGHSKAKRALLRLGGVRSMIEALEKGGEVGNIREQDIEGKCQARFCLPTGDSFRTIFEEAYRASSLTMTQSREQWMIWRAKMLEARDKDFERFGRVLDVWY